VGAAHSEISRHRDAIALLVETVEAFSREAKTNQEALGTRLEEVIIMNIYVHLSYIIYIYVYIHIYTYTGRVNPLTP